MRRNPLTITNNRQPLMGVEQLHSEIDNMFNTLIDEPFAPFSSPLLKIAGERNLLTPNMDLTESERSYEVCAELPGLNENDVKITYDNGVLTLSGEKSESKEDKNKNYHMIERSFGKFRRQVKLPTDIDDNKIEAKFQNGILKIGLPKTKEKLAQTKEIHISK
jgi:HSP20 family protein